MSFKFGSLFIKTTKRWYKMQSFTLGAATAFYTVISLPLLFVVLISIIRHYFDQSNLEHLVISTLDHLFSVQITSFLHNNTRLYLNTLSNVSVFLLLNLFIFGFAIFIQIQSNLNKLWGVTVRKNQSLLVIIKHRFLNYLGVFTLLFLLLITLVGEVVFVFIQNFASNFILFDIVSISIINQITSIILSFILFTCLFKFLPDVIINIKDAMTGAIVTTFLFLVGKWGIAYYLFNIFKDDVYGSANYFILILLWIYYSSLIFYWGANFTYLYTQNHGKKLKTLPYSKIHKL